MNRSRNTFLKRAGNFLKRDWYLLIIVAAGFVIGYFFYPHLPARVPVHWNSAGQPDGYGSRFSGAFSTPFTMLGLYLLFSVIPVIDHHAKNYEKFRGSYQMIKCLSITALLVIQACSLLTTVGIKISVNIVSGVVTSVAFILIGNVMGRFRHNYFVGIKTPWTLANEEVWRKTHRFAAPVWVLGGLAVLVLTLFNNRLMGVGVLIVVAVITVLPTVYSYLIFRRIGGEKQ